LALKELPLSIITNDSAARMGFAASKEVTAIIKSTEMLVATD
jgi:molybdopterin-binding protein